ncbi:MAG: hypothetical protein WAV73_02455 [Candidatus Moraniibacteriota bacterium]
MNQGVSDFLKNQEVKITTARNLRIWLTDAEKTALEKSGLALRLWIRLAYKISLRIWLHWKIVDWERQKSGPRVRQIPTPLLRSNKDLKLAREMAKKQKDLTY